MLARSVTISILLVLANSVVLAASTVAPSPQSNANALLAIDQNRQTVIDRIVAQWGVSLMQSDARLGPEQLRVMLGKLRADDLLAASLAGTLDGLRGVLARALTATETARSQTKALGDTADDLVYTPISPCRLFDTRPAQGGLGVMMPNVRRTYGAVTPVAQQGGPGGCNAPSGAVVALIEVGSLTPSGPGFVQGGAQGVASFPNALLLYQAGDQYGTAVAMPLNVANGEFDLRVQFSATDLYGDLLGFFRSPTGNGGKVYLQGGNAFGTSALVGTIDNQPLALLTNNQPTLRLVPLTDATNTDTVNVINGSPLNTVDPGVVGATIAGGSGTQGPTHFPHRVMASYGTIGGGLNNFAGGGSVDQGFATVGGGLSNTASNTSATIAGGNTNIASGDSATIGGGVLNEATGDISFVGGGKFNHASGNFATVAGGYQNTASGDYSTVGGFQNTASGINSAVGGGRSNNASGYGSVAAGDSNVASGAYSAVAGGQNNTAGGAYSIVAGGFQNSVNTFGTASFAAGRHALVTEQGEFVWADYTPTKFDPGDALDNQNGLYWADPTNTFNVRASGGVMLVTGLTGGGDPFTGVTVGPGSGTWVSHSDRNAKENFSAVEPRAILEKLVRLPIASWNYIGEGARVRHLGPVSQDFYAAFGLGADDHGIAVVDADGVSLAAIQGLHQLMREKDARIAALEHQVSELQALRGELVALKAMVSGMTSDGAALAGNRAERRVSNLPRPTELAATRPQSWAVCPARRSARGGGGAGLIN